MNRAVYITHNGKIEVKADKPSLEQMQAFVGGYIEPVSVTYEGKRCRMVCNEEGHLKGLPLNLQATQLWNAEGGDEIVGNVIILQGYRI